MGAAGTSKGSEVSRKGGEMWKTISDAERKPFEEQAKQQKEKYEAFLKTPEGKAAMKAFKEAQAAAKAEVKGAALLESPEKKRKVRALEGKDGEEEKSPAAKRA